MNITMKLTNELIFIYQLFISCTKFDLSDQETILYMNSIIKSNKIHYKLIDKDTIKELKRTTKRYLVEYNKLKVKDGCYKNPKLLALFYSLDTNNVINGYTYGTDQLVKQEYNKHNKLNNVN
jgi:hypothetical protein